MKTVQITLQVPMLKTKRDADDFAASVADHLMETFNDDHSILTCAFQAIPNNQYPRNAKFLSALQCAHCNGIIEDEGESVSTYCGSIHQGCIEDHQKQCEPCGEEDF